jgi:hypothetical protein
MTITCFYSIAGDILGATELRGPVNYKYKDLKSATKNFSEENKLGEGGFGDVYKVKLIEETRVKGKHFSSCYQIDLHLYLPILMHLQSSGFVVD